MDGLRIDEHSRVHQPSSLLSSKNIQENAAKTPRRGLGLMINEIKTPGSRSQPGSVQSTIRKASRAPVFEVFEDVNEKAEVSEKQEEEKEKQCSSPIEKVSRLSVSSIGGLEFNEEDIIALHDDENDVNQLGDGPEEDVLNLSVANLNIEEWDEYPPIEIASRFDRSVEDFTNYYDVDDVSLYDENPENLKWLPSDESIAKLTREEVDQWIEESELNEHDLETF